MIGFPGSAFALAVASWVVCTSALSQAPMTLDFSWRGIPGCSGGARSPAFYVRNAPRDTYRLLFTLSGSEEADEYGGEETPYPASGNVAPGLIYTYGPCQPGDYHWNVVALDRFGRALATADRTRPFP